MQLCGENIECKYLMPVLLNFDGDCLILLRRNLLAVAPQEGCALLIGDQQLTKDFHEKWLWNVRMIWPCCNAWDHRLINNSCSFNDKTLKNLRRLSKETGFVVDPREQIHAQRWARNQNFKVLGSAHSHPNGKMTPSLLDLDLSNSQGIVVIISNSGKVNGWWTRKDRSTHKLKVTNFSC